MQEHGSIKRIWKNLCFTRWLYEHVKDQKVGINKHDFAQSWPNIWLFVEIAGAALLAISTHYDCLSRHYLIVRWLSYLFALLAAFRLCEITHAYFYDMLDRVSGQPLEQWSLDKTARIRLVIKSYASLVINWAFLFYVVPANCFTVPKNAYELRQFFNALYFSGTTISTVGFGDITPTNWLSKALSISEVWTGLLMLVFVLGTYISIQADQNNISRAALKPSADVDTKDS